MKKRLWAAVDGEFVGSTGYATVEEMAEAMLANPDYRDYFEGNDNPEDLGEAVGFLNSCGIRAMHVPVRTFGSEVWSDSVRDHQPLDAKPGRGCIRVLGVSI